MLPTTETAMVICFIHPLDLAEKILANKGEYHTALNGDVILYGVRYIQSTDITRSKGEHTCS